MAIGGQRGGSARNLKIAGNASGRGEHQTNDEEDDKADGKVKIRPHGESRRKAPSGVNVGDRGKSGKPRRHSTPLSSTTTRMACRVNDENSDSPYSARTEFRPAHRRRNDGGSMDAGCDPRPGGVVHRGTRAVSRRRRTDPTGPVDI